MVDDLLIKERPILMSGPMVQAILREWKNPGTGKRQTRRMSRLDRFSNFPEVLSSKGWRIEDFVEEKEGLWLAVSNDESGEFPVSFDDPWVKCPYGKAGDRLWVRETIWNDSADSWLYSADHKFLPMNYPDGWLGKVDHKFSIPSIHMPRWASRILLEITGVRVERLQDISEEDANAAGVLFNPDYELYWDYQREQWICIDAVESYRTLINRINGKATWERNPWVWVVEFKIVEVKERAQDEV